MVNEIILHYKIFEKLGGPARRSHIGIILEVPNDR